MNGNFCAVCNLPANHAGPHDYAALRPAPQTPPNDAGQDAVRFGDVEEWLDGMTWLHDGKERVLELEWFIGDGSGIVKTRGKDFREACDAFAVLLQRPVGANAAPSAPSRTPDDAPSELMGPTREYDESERKPINVAHTTADALRHLLFEPEMRGVGYSEFVQRAVDATKREIARARATSPAPEPTRP